MKIKILKKYKGLTPFETPEFPDFTVLTGKNGSGKTQFLELTNHKQNPMSPKARNFLHLPDFSNYMEFQGDRPTKVELKSFHASISIGNSNLGYNTHLNMLQALQSLQAYKQGGADSRHSSQRSDNLERIAKLYSKSISSLTNNEVREYFYSAIDQHSGIINENITHIISGYFERKSNNIYNMTATQNFQEKLPYLTKEEFERKYPNPFNLINEAMKMAGFDYQLKKIDFADYEKNQKIYNPSFISDYNQKIPFDGFSSGERTLLWAALLIFNTRGEYAVKDSSSLLLLDEIDAGLHPGMTKKLINVIQNFLIPKGIKVILTTHSPSTVALAPETSIYVMKKETGKTFIEKGYKSEAIKSLLDGVRSIDIDSKNKKYVFTESDIDQYSYSKIYKFLREKLSSEIDMEFISSGRKKSSAQSNLTDVSANNSTEISGGSGQVKSIVKKLRDAGNLKIFGIIDWDNTINKNNGILVHGENEMYSLENIVLSPYFIGLFLLHEGKIEIPSIFPNETKNYIELFGNNENSTDKLNILSQYIEKQVIEENRGNLKQIKLINGGSIEIGEQYRLYKGHVLEAKIKEKFKSLNRYHNSNQLLKEVINRVIKIYYKFLPESSLNIFRKIQDQ